MRGIICQPEGLEPLLPPDKPLAALGAKDQKPNNRRWRILLTYFGRSWSSDVCGCLCCLCDPLDYGLPGSFSTEFSRQEYRSGLPFPSPGDILDSRVEPAFLRAPPLQVDSSLLSHQRSRGEMWVMVITCLHKSLCICLLPAKWGLSQCLPTWWSYFEE